MLCSKLKVKQPNGINWGYCQLHISHKAAKCITSPGSHVTVSINFHHQYLPELLVNVYRYCVIVKSILLLCSRKPDFVKFSHIYTKL